MRAAELTEVVQVKYANRINLPFLAVARGHGATQTQGELEHGLQINVGVLQRYEIEKDTNSVWLQGGVWGEGIIGDLWDAGYVTSK